MGGAREFCILTTDIAGSSRLAEQFGREYFSLLEHHDSLVRESSVAHNGRLYKHTGDGVLLLFDSAADCACCAVDLQRRLGGLSTPGGGDSLLVRIALHAGALAERDGEYFGPALNRVSRICQVISGGQVVASAALTELLSGALPEGIRLYDLGEHHLRDLAEPEHLYQLDHPGFGLHEFPPLATLNNRPNNLVAQPNRFIGRVRELEEMEGLLRGGLRLLTMIAPGGYGKSRLAAQLCANQLPHFERGCFMVYLASVREAQHVPLAIAKALGCQISAGRTPEQQLCDYLRGKELLLCLDNMEHLLECAPLVADALKAGPKLRVICTSREPLRIEGEHIYRLEPLCTEHSGEAYSDAQKLFADRARLVQPDFLLEAGNQAQVQAVCARLSGIPLAIELAAAWMDSFTLGELLGELAGQLELEARLSDKPPRHQSLKACLDWSWNLLGTEQQEALLRLSVFRGGFFADAASAVLNLKGMALRSTLAMLSDKSWLYSREVEGRTRFFLRDMLAHEFVLSKLEATRSVGTPPVGRRKAYPTETLPLYDSAAEAHAAYYAAFAGQQGPRLRGGGLPDGGQAQQAAWRSWHLELQNIQSALDTALERRNPGWLLAIGKHIGGYLDTTGANLLAREKFEALIKAAEEAGHSELLQRSKLGLGWALLRLSQFEEASAILSEVRASAEASGDAELLAQACDSLGLVQWSRGELAEAEGQIGRALRIYQESDNRQAAASVISHLGLVCYSTSDHRRAADHFRQALELHRASGNQSGVAVCLVNLGNIKRTTFEYEEAEALYSEALGIFRRIGHRQGEANCASSLGLVCMSTGDYARSLEYCRMALESYSDSGDRSMEDYARGNLARVHFALGDYQLAGRLFAEAIASCRETGDRQTLAYLLLDLGGLEYMRGNLELAGAQLDEVLSLSRELGDLGLQPRALSARATVLYAQGTTASSARHYWQALAAARSVGDWGTLAFIGAACSPLCSALGQYRAAAVGLRGAEAWATGHNHRFDANDQKQLDEAYAALERGLARGKFTMEELQLWREEAAALEPEALAAVLSSALESAAGGAAADATPQ